MSSNKRAKKKKAAEQARKSAARKQSTPVAKEEVKQETPVITETEKSVVAEVSEPAEYATQEKKTVEAGKTSGVLGGLSALLKKNKRCIFYGSAAIGLALAVAVIILSVRLGRVTKELEAMQTMSADYQTELADVKNELDEAELQLLSREPEKVYIEVYPTVTPEPTPEPVATPEPEKYLICVDAGHGDWDGGACVEGERYQILRAEKDDNLRMAKLFRDALLEYEDIEVLMTRETDVFLELQERTDIANEAEADALISFHRNSYAGEGDVSGVEFWIHSSRPKDAQALAQSMLNAIVEVGGMENRGVKYGSISSVRENYAINRRASMTSMIVELGFISSEKDNAAYDANGEAYAREMAKAVHEWLVNNKGK